MRILVACAVCALFAAPLHAQGAPAGAQPGIFAGTIARDTLGGVIAQAEVQLPELNRITISGPQGAFEFGDVAPGRHAVTVRAIGYQLLVDTIEIAPGQRLDADIVLSPVPVTLPEARTLAKAVEKRLPAGIQEMEERRKSHLGGYFVTDSMLRANDDRKLTYFFAQMPSVNQLFAQGGSGIFLANARIPSVTPCYMDVYVDGALYFRGPASGTNPPPDFNAFWATGFSGVEFYPGGATVPAQYNATGSGCGVILLWTRRTP